MTTSTESTADKFEFNQEIRFIRNDDGGLVGIPSSDHLEGYLGYDSREECFVQIKLLKCDDAETSKAFARVWGRIEGNDDLTLCPIIATHGEENAIPYYVSSFPVGEPISQFVQKGGPLPPEVAAATVLRFIKSLVTQDPLLFREFAMCPASLWISRETEEPRIIFGEFAVSIDDEPEAKNVFLCSDLLKYLSGNPPFDEAFQALCEAIAEGPQTVEHFRERLERYVARHPASEFWNDKNLPKSILQQLIPSKPDVRPSKKTVSWSPVRRSVIWKKLSFLKPFFAVAIAALVLGLAASVLLEVFTDPDSEIASLVSNQQTASEQALGSTGTQSMELAEGELVEPDASVAASSSEPGMAPAPIGQGDPNTSAISSLEEPTSEESAAELDSIFKDSKKNSEVGDPVPEVLEPGEAIATLPEVLTPKLTPNLPPDTGNKLDLIASTAARARENNRLTKAIEHELIYLDLEPDSRAAYLRLHEDLQNLYLAADRPLKAEDITVLEKAVAYSSKAYDVLVKHYREEGDWKREISTLVRQARTGNPAKLTEAGERIFQNPDATQLDKKKARGYFIEAADLGDAAGQFFAGECMILGRGGEKNLSQGAYYLRRAVDQKDARAMDLLGVCYVRSWGVQRDDIRAVHLFESAIEHGNIPAYYNLGARYAQGQGVERNPRKAAELFEEGGRKGNPLCMLVLARCFESGYGREQNDQKAIYWFSKSAEKGNPDAIRWCRENDIDFVKVLAAES